MDYSLGNFGFLKQDHTELYQILLGAEREAHTNFILCGQNCRKALEAMTNEQIYRHNLQSYFFETGDYKDSTLANMLYKLTNEDFLRSVHFISEKETVQEKSFFPLLPKVSYHYVNGERAEKVYWNKMLREVGNTCAHEHDFDRSVRLTYPLMRRCVEFLFYIAKFFYMDSVDPDYQRFIEDRMPIRQYFIKEGGARKSREESSSLVTEYMAYTKDIQGNIMNHAFLRMYQNDETQRKEYNNLTFLLRNQQAYNDASRQDRHEDMAMEPPHEIVSADDPNTQFYFIVQEFQQEPKRLRTFLREKKNVAEENSLYKRVKLCSRIADCMCKLHNLPNPIYHRMLNYDSLCICEIRGEWHPYFVKFDYAKISSGHASGTVYVSADERARMIQEEVMRKYIAPEWDSISGDIRNYEWAAVDVYSLGVLFGDILCERITPDLMGYDELIYAGVSEELAGFIEEMTSEVPAVRWPIDDVRDAFSEEVSRLEHLLHKGINGSMLAWKSVQSP